MNVYLPVFLLYSVWLQIHKKKSFERMRIICALSLPHQVATSSHTNAPNFTGYVLCTFSPPTDSITIYTQISFVASAVLSHVPSPPTFACKPKSQLLQIQHALNYS